MGDFLGQSVTLLDAADQLLAAAFGDVEIVIGQLAPLLLDLALELFPVPFHAVIVHSDLLLVSYESAGFATCLCRRVRRDATVGRAAARKGRTRRLQGVVLSRQ